MYICMYVYIYIYIQQAVRPAEMLCMRPEATSIRPKMCACACMHVCVLCVCVCVCVCVHTYIHIHIHIRYIAGVAPCSNAYYKSKEMLKLASTAHPLRPHAQLLRSSSGLMLKLASTANP
jgi:hypothetical protein